MDTSKVPADQRAIVTSLTNLFNSCAAAVASQPAKKREMDDSSKRLGALFWKLNAGDVSPSVAGKLLQMAQALDAGEIATAMQINVGLTTSDWDECSNWLQALKRLLKSPRA